MAELCHGSSFSVHLGKLFLCSSGFVRSSRVSSRTSELIPLELPSVPRCNRPLRGQASDNAGGDGRLQRGANQRVLRGRRRHRQHPVLAIPGVALAAGLVAVLDQGVRVRLESALGVFYRRSIKPAERRLSAIWAGRARSRLGLWTNLAAFEAGFGEDADLGGATAVWWVSCGHLAGRGPSGLCFRPKFCRGRRCSEPFWPGSASLAPKSTTSPNSEP